MTQQRNWRHRLKWLGLGLVVLLALLMLTKTVLTLRAGGRLEAAFSQLRAAGEPTSIAELAPQPVVEEQNAAAQLRGLQSQLEDFSRDWAAFYKTPLGEACEVLDGRGALPTDEQCQAISAVLEKHSELVDELERISHMSDYASLLDFSAGYADFLGEMIDGKAPPRPIARLLKWRMQVLAVAGEPDAAVEAGIQLLRLVRLFEHEPAMVNQLIAVACRQIACQGLNQALRGQRITADSCAKLNAELVLHDNTNRLARVLSEERALGLEGMAGWRSGMGGMVFGWQFANWQADLVDFYDTQLRFAEKPWYQGHEGIGDAELADEYPAVVWLLQPAVQSTYEAYNRDIALLRCLRILNTLGAYRDVNGQEAAGLADLDLPAEAALDPFSGNPLIVQSTDEGWLIYTIFKNGIDDGGDFKDLRDWGVSPVLVESE